MVRSIERFVEAVGRVVSLGIFLLIGVVMYEVLARYFFNLPTRWTYDTSGWLQVAYVFLGGAYALQRVTSSASTSFTSMPRRARRPGLT